LSTPAGQTALKNLSSSGAVQPVIPRFPRLAVDTKLASAFPGHKSAVDKFNGELEDWRVKTNVAILGGAPPASI